MGKDIMAKKMLIDATHPEETRVVVADGTKVEEFDFESLNKRQLAGNIYLAKVTRVEPSLQAAFVDYGGNRHGFLAFSEIHPDYYQIPVADREALLAEERAYAEAQAAEDDNPKPKPKKRRTRRKKNAEVQAEKGPQDAVLTGEASGPSSMDVVEIEDGGDGPVGVSEGDESPILGEAQTAAAEGAQPAESAAGQEAVDAEAPEGEAAQSLTDALTQSKDADESIADADGEAELPQVETLAADAGEAVSQDTPEQPDAQPETPVEGADASETEGQGDAIDPATANDGADTADDAPDTDQDDDEDADPKPSAETVADDDTEEDIRPVRKPRPRRYKIQEVVKVRQIMLVQVVKEERGNKGAALTTYLSIAGRYCVLMPNTARGGGISRKITNAADRKKLKEIATGLDVPQGAGLIVRTAGAKRTKTEIKRDYEYLQRQWEQVRSLTLESTAPAPIYEEGNLIHRSIRDLYNRDIDEVLVEGEAGYRQAKDFMKMIMPSHAKNVKNYTDPMPLFARHKVEAYLADMFNPTVQLKSGGYIVIGVTEALVAIDVNSGRATKEGSIEETATKTNLEAAEEVARQLRLRDLAGLIVIDFIDMDDRRNNAAVEKKIKEKLKTDRARIQVGRISAFGLMEMSRQRLRPGMIEATTQPCPHCHGTGIVRSDDSLALSILRQLEEEGTRRRAREVLLTAPVGIVNFIMNAKRDYLAAIESRYGLSIRVEADPALVSPDFKIEKFKTATRRVPASAPVVSMDTALMDEVEDAVEIEEEEAEEVAAAEAPSADEEAPKKKRRRRRGGRGRRKSGAQGDGTQSADEGSDDATSVEGEGSEPEATEALNGGAAQEETSGAVEMSAETGKPVDPEGAPKPDAEAPTEDASDAEPVSPVAELGVPETVEPIVEAPAEADPAAQRAEPVAEADLSEDEALALQGANRVDENAPEPAASDAADAPSEEAEAAAEPVVEPSEPEPVVTPDPEPTPASAEPPKPKRKGWWSLG